MTIIGLVFWMWVLAHNTFGESSIVILESNIRCRSTFWAVVATLRSAGKRKPLVSLKHDGPVVYLRAPQAHRRHFNRQACGGASRREVRAAFFLKAAVRPFGI